MLTASSRASWYAFGCAVVVRGLDWLLGNTTSLTEFAIIMGLSGVLWGSLAVMCRCWCEIRERRRIELLSELSTVDQ